MNDKNKSALLAMGYRIRVRREQLGLSQEQLALSAGYKSRSSINKIELGKNDLTQSAIARIAEALNTTTGYILGTSSEWEKRFLDNLEALYTNTNEADLLSAGIDRAEVEAILSGSLPLSFDAACSIADQFGESLDDMLGKKNKNSPSLIKGDGVDSQIIDLFLSLSESAKGEALSYIRFLSEREEK